MFRRMASCNFATGIAIVVAIGSPPSAAVAAAEETHADGVVMQGAPVLLTPDIESEIASNKKSLDSLGYVDRPTEQSQAQFALSRIRERESTATTTTESSTTTGQSKSRGFYKLGVDELPNLPFSVSRLPPGLVQADSANYLLPLPHQVTRIFTKTQLGTVLVREINNATLYAEGPDAKQERVGGFNVYRTTVRYADSQWVTFILASKGKRVVQIEVGSRIVSQKHQAQLGSLVSSLLADKQGILTE